MTPPFESLLLCAEECPLSMALLLQLWKHCWEESIDHVQFERDDFEEWPELLESLEGLARASLIKLEFYGRNKVEVTLPIALKIGKCPPLDL